MKSIALISILLAALCSFGCSGESESSEFVYTIEKVKSRHGDDVEIYGDSQGPFKDGGAWLLARPTPDSPQTTLTWKENGQEKQKLIEPTPGHITWGTRYDAADGSFIIVVELRKEVDAASESGQPGTTTHSQSAAD